MKTISKKAYNYIDVKLDFELPTSETLRNLAWELVWVDLWDNIGTVVWSQLWDDHLSGSEDNRSAP